MTSTPRLGNDLGHLVNLPLRAAEGTELWAVNIWSWQTVELRWEMYPLLGQTTGTLVLGVSEQFDNTLLVWGKTARSLLVIIHSGRLRREGMKSTLIAQTNASPR